MKLYTKYLTLVLLGAGLALGACSSSSDDPPPPPPVVEPEPTAYEAAKAAIDAATTAEAAQAAYDAVKDDVTAAQGDMLQAAVDARIAAINTAARTAEQKMALANAAGAIDTSDLSTQAAVDAARTAIATLRGLLMGSPDVSDTDKAMYQTALNNAVDAVDAAQGGIDTATRRTNQMGVLSDASDTLQSALSALGGNPTQALVDAANTALAGLNAALGDAADLTDEEKAPYQHEATNASGPIQTAQTAVNDAKDDADDAADKAMAALAAKLYAGISAQMGDGDLTNLQANDRDAGYTGTNQSQIGVSIGSTDAPAAAIVALSEDKKTMVAALHGWTGKRFHKTTPASEGTYEAHVYSNVEASTQGNKFGQIGVGTPVTGYVYGLNANGQAAIDTSATATYVNLIDGSNFDHSAGVKRFPLPSPNPGLATVRSVSGTFHGVPGTYSCTPGNAVCAVNVSGSGFQLGTVPSATDATFTNGGGTWMFQPSNPETRVMSAADTVYASYGWWLHTATNGNLTASAFVDVKGASNEAIDDDDPASGLDALDGTATYMGGAAGKYALASSTGGTNDAGHFTARATLEANFTTNTAATAITGTIDEFIGADGESRDWEVELKGSSISNTGVIGDSTDGTAWTIGDTAAAADGEWTGQLRHNGTDGVPEVATGTFFSTYGRSGRMVGAFGANKQ